MLAEPQETPGQRSYLAGEIDHARQALCLNQFTVCQIADARVALRDASAFKAHLRRYMTEAVGRLVVTDERIKEREHTYSRGVEYSISGVFLTTEEALRISAALRLAAEVAERFAYK